jgi:hypothetical protein
MWLLERAAWLEEQLARLGDGEVVVSYGAQPHWNEYIYTHSGAGRQMMDMFHQLVKAGSRPSSTYNAEFPVLGKIEGMVGASYIVMPRLLAEAVRELRTAVGDALKAEYEAGKRDGHMLLIRLAQGDISVNEFDATVER